MNILSSKVALLPAGLLALSLAACGGGGGVTGSDQSSNDKDDESSSDSDGNNDDDTSDTPTGSKDAGRRDSGVKTDGGKTGTSDAGTGNGGPKTGGQNLPCDVQSIVEDHCQGCHAASPLYGAPMSLMTLADFQKAGELDKVHTRINAKDKTVMPPPSNNIAQPLTSDQLTTLNTWIGAGAPGSSDTCSDTGGGGGGGGGGGTTDNDAGVVEGDKTGLDCYKLTAHGTGQGSKFPVGVAIDSYYNFTFDAPWTGTAYGVLFTPVVDNKKALHHFLLFQNNSKTKASASGVKSSGAHPDGQLVYGWAPGGDPLDFRVAGAGVDVGMELPGTVSYTVEYHYNSSDAAAQDASGVELCVSKTKPANIAGISWLGYDQLGVPSTTWTGTCRPQNTQPVHILGVQPHMHVTGTHMKAIIHRVGGKDETLHDEDFDFNNQKHYYKNVTINPGDSITTTCTYNKPMAFGESTGQEMCYLFTFAYAKGQLKDSGPWGSVAHGGSACLGQ